MKRFPAYLIFLLTIAWLSGCRKENFTIAPDPEEVEVTFSYRTPAQLEWTTETKGTGLTQEGLNKVSNALVLMYVQESGNQIFKYYRKIYDLQDDWQNAKGSFKVTLPKSKNGEQYVFDIILNAIPNIPNQITSGRVELDMPREQVQALFGNNSASFTSGNIPMWCTVNTPTVISNDMAPFVTTRAIRSGAFFSVALNQDDQGVIHGIPNFKLTSVSVVNMPTWFRYIPDMSNLNGAMDQVTAPSFVTGYTNPNSTTVFSVVNTSAIGNDNFGYYSSSMAPENIPTAGNTHCFVMNGTWTDPATGIAHTGWYRLNVLDPNDPTKKLQILRNNHYFLNVKGIIDSRGWTTATAAASDTKFLETTATIPALTVSDPDLNFVRYSGSTYMAISEKEITIPPYFLGWPVVVKTNYGSSSNTTGGWEATIAPGSEWISLSQTIWNTNNSAQYADPQRFDIIATPNTGPLRTGYVHFNLRGQTAPPLHITLVVHQPTSN